MNEPPSVCGYFELRKREDTGRLYWWGAESEWKDGTEVGHRGVLTLDGRHFPVGTRIVVRSDEQKGDGT